jgi:hypothetical protein
LHLDVVAEELEVEEPCETLIADSKGGAVKAGVTARTDDATLPSGVPTGADVASSFYVKPEYEWPEVARRGKAPGLRQLAALIRLDVSSWQGERTASKGLPNGKGGRPLIIAVAVVVVMFVALAALAVYGIGALVTGNGALGGFGADVLEANGSGTDGQVVTQTPATREKNASIPNLATLPGLSVDDALMLLGEGWELDDGSATDAPGATGATNTARIVFVPSQTTTEDGAVISVSLSNNGNVAGVTFTCPMEVLGYPKTDFYNVISDRELLFSALGRAGIAPDRADLAAPASEDTAVWKIPDDPTSGLRQEAWTFTGYGSGAREDVWALTVTYDYGNGSTNNSADTAVSAAPVPIMEIGIY